MTSREWIDRYARLLGVEPPTDEQFNQILAIAGVAAHASERTAAPVACWLGGTTGRPLEELQEIAQQVEADEA